MKDNFSAQPERKRYEIYNNNNNNNNNNIIKVSTRLSIDTNWGHLKGLQSSGLCTNSIVEHYSYLQDLYQNPSIKTQKLRNTLSYVSEVRKSNSLGLLNLN